MKRHRKRISLPAPPEGYMLNYYSGGLLRIKDVEWTMKYSLKLFDLGKYEDPHFYKNDPSYYWNRKDPEK